jgi:hypothetical protein
MKSIVLENLFIRQGNIQGSTPYALKFWYIIKRRGSYGQAKIEKFNT